MKEDILGYAMIIFILLVSYKIYTESDYFNLKCIVSDVDGNKYCVRENRKNKKEASDLLAKTVVKLNKLIKHLDAKYKTDDKIKRIVKNYNPKKIVETLPNSEYTAYSENKGRKIALCLNEEKQNNSSLIDENTLMFVALHEVSHISTVSNGHHPEFWDNFKFILTEANEINIINLEDYNNKNTTYCGMSIKSNPYFDR